jgi:glycosyltransferase involved in cell wall biosynthesis
VRDAIVFSAWTWETFNVPERIALALARLGARVLYCEHPVSLLRQPSAGTRVLEDGIVAFRPRFLADKANRLRFARSLQARSLARQICEKAETLKLRAPLFYYPWLGDQISILPHMRSKFGLVHIQMDYGEPNIEGHVDFSDYTLTIPRSVYHQQRGRFGDKIRSIPQAVDLRYFVESAKDGSIEPSPEFASIPRPRLGYLGPAFQRINKPLATELLQKHPEWHFVSVDREKPLPLPNAHILPWQSNRDSPKYVAGFDVGFMPYDCFDGHNLYCLPLKLFEYFALGLPVVSTPIIELWDFEDLVYLGDTATELEQAVSQALQESSDSPKRKRRMEIAKRHSIEILGESLKRALPLSE